MQCFWHLWNPKKFKLSRKDLKVKSSQVSTMFLSKLQWCCFEMKNREVLWFEIKLHLGRHEQSCLSLLFENSQLSLLLSFRSLLKEWEYTKKTLTNHQSKNHWAENQSSKTCSADNSSKNPTKTNPRNKETIL